VEILSEAWVEPQIQGEQGFVRLQRLEKLLNVLLLKLVVSQIYQPYVGVILQLELQVLGKT